MDQTYVRHFDQCLGCMACISACPSGVHYGRLIESTRAQVERHYRRPLAERLFRWLIFSLFPHPGRLRAALLTPCGSIERSGLRWLLQQDRIVRFSRTAASHGKPAAGALAEIVFEQPAEALQPEGAPRMKWG